MKQVFFTAGGQVLVENVPAPVVQRGQILVEVTHSLVSTGTELAGTGGGDGIVKKVLKDPLLVKRAYDFALQHGIKKTYQLATGSGPQGALPLGYSAAGRVAEVGPDVAGFVVGDRVAIAGAGIACHAEYDVAPVNLAVNVPADVPLREACFTTVGAIALQGVRRAQPTLGETIVVVGLGLIGQLTVQLLLANGCRVLGVDLKPDRLARAEAAGAAAAFAPDAHGFADRVLAATEARGADAVIVTAAAKTSNLANQALTACRRKGRVVIVGDVGMDLDRAPFYQKELDFLISTSYGPGRYDRRYEHEGVDYPPAYVRWTENRNMRAFLDLVAQGKVRPGGMITIEEPVDEAVGVYRRLAAPEEGGLAAVFAYPAAARDHVRAARATKVELAPAKTSDKLGVAIIGLGGYATAFHVPNFHRHPHTDLLGVVTRQGIVAKRIAQDVGARLAATDYREALAEPALDTVVIATRHNTHAPLACAAAAAGKHIFVEKPLALDEAGLAEVIRAVERAGVQLTIGHNRRFSPHVRALKKWRDRHPGPVQMTYTVNAGPLPPTHWTLDLNEGGGRLVGEACHFFDLLAYLAGAAPTAVHAVGIPEPDADPQLWQNLTVALTFADGSVGRVDYASRGNASYPKERVELFAGNAVGVIDDFQRTTFYGSAGHSLKTAAIDKGQREQVDDWVAFLRGEPAQPILLREAIVGTLVALRAVRSLKQSASVPVDADGFFAAASAAEE